MRAKIVQTIQVIALSIVSMAVIIWLIMPEYNPSRLKEAEIAACNASLRGVQSSLDLYFSHYKNYPVNLEVLIKEEYLDKKWHFDNWGNKLKYQPIFEKDSKGKAINYLLGSNGPDGKENSDDDIEPPIDTIKHSFKQKPTTPSGLKAK